MPMASPKASSLLLLFELVGASRNSADSYYHNHPNVQNSMWVLGTGGVSIYSIDGKTLIKSLANTNICLEATSRGSTTQNCGFKDAVSDGHRHVWATNTQGGSFVEVFSIATGLHVASLPSCNFPYYLDYAPHREELWVHCWSPDENKGDSGHIDTYSTFALGLNHQQVALVSNLESHGHGKVVLDASIPNYGYGTLLDHNVIFKVDLRTKQVVANLTGSGFDLINGFYRESYSALNKHLYLRAYVCCSCGVNGDTQQACSTRGGGPSNVLIKTGPSAGTVAPGHCGHSCEGSLADTIGVVEYDLVGERVVGTHPPIAGRGANPWTSPKGDYTLLLGNDGSSVQVLKPGGNGAASTVVGPMSLGFNHGGTASPISDVTFVEDKTHNIAVFTSTLDNFVVLIDMASFLAGTPKTKRINLQAADDTRLPSSNGGSSSGHGRGATRAVTWAPGSNYIWVNSNAIQEVAVIKLGHDGDIENARIVKKLTNLPSTRMVYVNDYENPYKGTHTPSPYSTLGAGACRGSGGSNDKVNSRHTKDFTAKAQCEEACDGLTSSDALCAGYAWESSGDKECILYGPGMAGSCASPNAGFDEATCKAKGTCAGSTEATSEDACGECSDATAKKKDACATIGGAWTAGTWTSTATWEPPEGGWSGEFHHTDHVHAANGNANYECFDKDVTDSVGKCTNSADTPTGTDCVAIFAAASTYGEDKCKTAAPDKCTWTAATTAPNQKPTHPTAAQIVGFTPKSGACRGPTMNDRPPYVYRKNVNFPSFPAWATPTALGMWCDQLNDAHAMNPTTNPATCLGFHSGPWVSVFGVGMNETDPGISSDWIADKGAGNDPSGTHYHPGGNDALVKTKPNHQYVCWIRDDGNKPVALSSTRQALTGKKSGDFGQMSEASLAALVISCVAAAASFFALLMQCISMRKFNAPIPTSTTAHRLEMPAIQIESKA